MRQRFLNMLVALDQLLWVWLSFGAGAPDETLSAAAYRMERQGKIAGRILRPLIDAIFSPLEREHCWLAYQSEVLVGAQKLNATRCVSLNVRSVAFNSIMRRI